MLDLPITSKVFEEGMLNVTAVPALVGTTMIEAAPLEMLTSIVEPFTKKVFPVPTKLSVSALPIKAPPD